MPDQQQASLAAHTRTETPHLVAHNWQSGRANLRLWASAGELELSMNEVNLEMPVMAEAENILPITPRKSLQAIDDCLEPAWGSSPHAVIYNWHESSSVALLRRGKTISGIRRTKYSRTPERKSVAPSTVEEYAGVTPPAYGERRSAFPPQGSGASVAAHSVTLGRRGGGKRDNSSEKISNHHPDRAPASPP